MTLDNVTPPPEYPGTEWIEDTGAPYYVPAHLRARYAAEAASPEMFAQHPRAIGVAPDYAGWAHRHRLARAQQADATARREAEREASLPVCPVCNRKYDRLAREGRVVRRNLSTAPGASPAVVEVCYRCERHANDALSGRDVLDDGRTRAEAAAVWADEWTGRSERPGRPSRARATSGAA